MFKFYTELSLDDSIEQKLPNWSLDDPYSYRQWYHEDITGKENLVITVGDSWTWGDHLGCIDWEKAVNDPIRLTQIHGRVLSDKLNADWINLALPGCSNYWMLEQLQDMKHHFTRVKEQYKRIIVVVSFTEDLRESLYTKRIDVDTPYFKLWDESLSLRDFLDKVETYTINQYKEYFAEIPFVEFKLGRAFTDFATTDSVLLEKTWCDVIQDHVQFSNYTKNVPFIGSMSIKPLTEKFLPRNPSRKQEFCDIMELVKTRWDFFGYSELNLKGSTHHPTPDGHRVWADYVFSQIQ